MNKINRRGLAMMLWAICGLALVENTIELQVVAFIMAGVGFLTLFFDWED